MATAQNEVDNAEKEQTAAAEADDASAFSGYSGGVQRFEWTDQAGQAFVVEEEQAISTEPHEEPELGVPHSDPGQMSMADEEAYDDMMVKEAMEHHRRLMLKQSSEEETRNVVGEKTGNLRRQ